MKIILIYTPRSGSKSILYYFSRLNPEYMCIDEPWFDWMTQNIHHKVFDYYDVLSNKNIFIKSAYRTLPVSIDQVVNDFDKVIFLLRKNTKEQVESAIVTDINKSYVDCSTKKYWINEISDEDIKSSFERFQFLNVVLTEAAIRHNKPLFYYEDLYYGSFEPLFKELGLEHNEKYFDELLNNKNKYRDTTVDILSKTTKSLL